MTTKQPGQGLTEEQAAQDRYPRLARVLSAMLDDPSLKDAAIKRVTLHCLASGEVIGKVGYLAEEEPQGLYYTGV